MYVEPSRVGACLRPRVMNVMMIDELLLQMNGHACVWSLNDVGCGREMALIGDGAAWAQNTCPLLGSTQ